MSSLRVFSILFVALVSMNHPTWSSKLNITSEEHLITEMRSEHLAYEWTIQNFTLYCRNTDCIESSYFHTESNTVQWKLTFCSGLNSGNAASVSLNSYKDNSWVRIDAVWLCFISKSGQKVAVNSRSNDGQMGLESLSSSSNSDDNITIRCVIDMPWEPITKTINVEEPIEEEKPSPPQKSQLIEDYRQLLRDSKFSDVDIIVGSEILLAHELVLSVRSSVFAELLQDVERNDTGKVQITIDNMEPDVMKAMLEYLYTDQVSDIDELSLAYELIPAADEFKLPGLKTMCADALHRKLAADNAADIMVLSDRYHLDKLKKKAMEFIRNHFPDVMETESYQKMKDKYPALLMEILFSATDRRF